MRMVWFALWMGLVLSACNTQPPSPVSPGQWESVEPFYQNALLIRERVSYRSGGLKIYGQLCRPNRAGPFPILVWNHGGFEGLMQSDLEACQNFAALGYMALMSSYRGEDGSQGQVEVCQGEVDDVLRMLEIGRSMPYANPSRVAVAGGSHGGCISLRAVQKGAPAQVLVDIYGPSDWAAEHQQLQTLLASGDATQKQTAQTLKPLIESALGGTPARVPQAYQARSPLEYSSTLSNWPGSVLVVHGVQDWLVPVDQSCRLVGAVGGFSSYHISSSNTTLTTAPAGCESAGLSWTGGDLPRGSWAGQRYLLVYDRLGHSGGDQANLALLDILNYLGNKFPAG